MLRLGRRRQDKQHLSVILLNFLLAVSFDSLLIVYTVVTVLSQPSLDWTCEMQMCVTISISNPVLKICNYLWLCARAVGSEVRELVSA